MDGCHTTTLLFSSLAAKGQNVETEIRKCKGKTLNPVCCN
jgi:hypothetical protein